MLIVDKNILPWRDSSMHLNHFWPLPCFLNITLSSDHQMYFTITPEGAGQRSAATFSRPGKEVKHGCFPPR